MPAPRLARLVLALVLTGVLSFTFALAAPAPLRPAVALETDDTGLSRLVVTATVDGRAKRTVLRETRAQVAIDSAGGGPEGRTAFATWREDGTSWMAYTRDGGRTWSEARAFDARLMLRDGHPQPVDAMPFAPQTLALRAGGRVFIAQMTTVALPEWRAALESAGAEIVGFIPHNAFVVRAGESARAKLAGFDFVARIEPYHPWYRIAPELRSWVESGATDEDSKRRVRVMAFEWGAAGKARIADAARSLGAEVVELFPSGHVLELVLAPAQARELAHHDDVTWIDAWSPRETDMDLVREDGGANFIEATLGYCGQGVRGEVLDAGIQADHPDFDGILLHKNANVDSHGTSTFGIVFGNGARDGDGQAQGEGNMPCAEQGIFADYDELGDRFVHTQELKAAPYFAAFQTNSWGNATTTLYNSYSSEMDDIIWRLDFAILNSQSNTGNRNSRPQAWAKNIISVGGIRHYDTLSTGDDAWAGGASIGPAEDGRIKPDINYWYDNIYTTTTGSGYTAGFGGTSAATPESAGILGLIAQMWSDNVFGTDPEGATVFEKLPSASTLKALLINTARQYAFSGQSADLTRVHQGWGRPSARVAYERAQQSFIVDQEIELEFGGLASFDVDVEAGTPELKITMIYPEPPGTTSATVHRINDLDLRVTSPSGVIYHGNVGLLDGPYSQPGGTPNAIDPVENVFIQSPEDGIWKVEVEAREINQDAWLATPALDATFSLVATGGTGSLCDGPAASFTIDSSPSLVGVPVLFDSTVEGGAGGPFTYAWDFDGDARIDSIDADPTFVYHRPYEGLVKLKVRDVAKCPSRAEQPIAITGPDLRYDGQVSLVEVEGNGNGAVDPGEVFDLVVAVRNQGNEDATGVTAHLAPAPSEGSLSVMQDAASFGDIAIGGSAAGAQAYRFQIGQNFVCGNDATFSLVQIASNGPANVYPDELAVVKILVGGSGPPVVFLREGFEGSPGWSSSGSGEWQLAAPQGLGGGSAIPGFTPKPDPGTAFEGTRVLGNDITGTGTSAGNYENNVNSFYTSPALDCSDAIDVQLSFAKWLNVLPNDIARVQASANGTEWVTLYETSEDLDEAWSMLSFDVSSLADRNGNFRLRYGITSDATAVTSGWNIDALEFSGVTSSSCEPIARGVPGFTSGLTVAKDGSGGLSLAWNADCGAGSRYGIYRGDLSIGYASLAADTCDLQTTSSTISAGTTPAEFFLVVPSDAAFEGSYGKDSTGTDRPTASTVCHPQDVIDLCAR